MGRKVRLGKKALVDIGGGTTDICYPFHDGINRHTAAPFGKCYYQDIKAGCQQFMVTTELQTKFGAAVTQTNQEMK